jgi:geranylgeranyl diphosphate synthase type I
VRASPLDRADLRVRVDKALSAFLSRQRDRLASIDAALLPVADAVEAFVLGGGKRLRPAFAYWGYRAAGGVDSDEVVAAAAALELVQASALMHTT